MATPSFTWDDARVFLAVQRSGSHGGAARLLGVDVSTVGRRVAALERALGARLFERTRVGVALTVAGGAFLAHAARMEEAADAAVRELGGADARVTGSVRLTATDGVLHALLLPALGALRRAHPGLVLEVAPDLRTFSLPRREADVAVRLFRPKEQSLVVRRLGTLHFRLFASRAYLARHGAPASVAELAGHDLVGFDASIDGSPLQRWLQRQVPSPRWALRSTTVTAQVVACAHGLGIAALPTVVARREEALVPVLSSLEPFPLAVWSAVHEDLHRKARVTAVLRWLQEVFQQAAA